ncbi:hypothetical protein [Enterococcus phage SSsP-1]|uniref:Uncharacterized protein n=1 Tax=Enterococcus phage SSsP-1 TaxID=2859527 RepID=A0AAE7WEQ1_9CAUD|nr:hypothetical protein [Enterococcus phage SSsP-1]
MQLGLKAFHKIRWRLFRSDFLKTRKRKALEMFSQKLF